MLSCSNRSTELIQWVQASPIQPGFHGLRESFWQREDQCGILSDNTLRVNILNLWKMWARASPAFSPMKQSTRMSRREVPIFYATFNILNGNIMAATPELGIKFIYACLAHLRLAGRNILSFFLEKAALLPVKYFKNFGEEKNRLEANLKMLQL